MAEPRAYAVKAAFDRLGGAVTIERHKTMYGGKRIAPGDIAYLIDSTAGLVGRGSVTAAHPIPLDGALDRQTPRVSVTIDGIVPARQPLDRAVLKPHADGDGSAAELWFKLYRQATDKIVGLDPATAAWLDGRFG